MICLYAPVGYWPSRRVGLCGSQKERSVDVAKLQTELREGALGHHAEIDELTSQQQREIDKLNDEQLVVRTECNRQDRARGDPRSCRETH